MMIDTLLGTNSTATIATYLLIGMTIGLLIGLLVAKIKSNSLQNQLKTERLLHEQKINSLREASDEMANRFSALSSRALQENNELFLKLAEENLNKHHGKAQAELDKKEKSIESLLKPIRETLDKTETQLRDIEKDRKEAYGSLTQHLKSMADTQARLQSETHNLVSALRRPEVRGQWGELTLKRLAEVAGMSQHCDFYEQENTSTEEGNIRPDMIVRMPDQRELIVDAKTSLDAYLNAVQAEDDAERKRQLERHARKMRDRVNELAKKSYWAQFKNSPDFVILFVPGDQFLSAALEQDFSLLEYALNNKVILATPTSLIALLRAVAFGWRQQVVAQNAEKIQTLGEDLYHRIATFTEHLSKLGRSLGGSIDSYNSAVGSLERNVLSGARKFVELGIENKKTVEELDSIETNPKKLNNDT